MAIFLAIDHNMRTVAPTRTKTFGDAGLLVSVGALRGDELRPSSPGVDQLDSAPNQEWKALVEVVEREEERAFAFITGGSANNFVQWGYRLEPDGDGTLLTEHWELRNLSPIMVENGDEEVQRRRSNAIESLGKTLGAMKATAEAG